MAGRATHAETIVENDHEIHLLCELVRFPGKDAEGFFEAHTLCDRWIRDRGINPIHLLEKFEHTYRLLEWATEERNKRHHRLTPAVDSTLDQIAALCKKKGKIFVDPRRQGELAYEGAFGGELSTEEIALIQAHRKAKTSRSPRGKPQESAPEANEEAPANDENADDGIIREELPPPPPTRTEPKRREKKRAATEA